MATDVDGDVEMKDATSTETGGEIDENLYSRQIFVMGKEAMIKMQSANVLVAGLNGVGVEIGLSIHLLFSWLASHWKS